MSGGNQADDRRDDEYRVVGEERRRMEEKREEKREEKKAIKLPESVTREVKRHFINIQNLLKFTLIGLLVLALNNVFMHIFDEYFPEHHSFKGKVIYFIVLFLIIVLVMRVNIDYNSIVDPDKK